MRSVDEAGRRRDGGVMCEGSFTADLAGVGRQRFDQDAHCCPVIEGEARTVDEAETGAGAGNLGDQGGFAEAHLAHTLAKAFIPGEFAHTASGANRQLAKGREVFARGRGHWEL